MRLIDDRISRMDEEIELDLKNETFNIIGITKHWYWVSIGWIINDDKHNGYHSLNKGCQSITRSQNCSMDLQNWRQSIETNEKVIAVVMELYGYKRDPHRNVIIGLIPKKHINKDKWMIYYILMMVNIH